MAKLTTKDKELMDKNPSITDPHQLLLMGLSEQGFNILVEEQKGKAHTDVTATKPVLRPVKHILQPSLDTPAPASGNTAEKARLVPISGGKGSLMSKKRAESMVKRYPTQFKLG